MGYTVNATVRMLLQWKEDGVEASGVTERQGKRGNRNRDEVKKEKSVALDAARPEKAS